LATFLSNPWPTASSSERNLGGREKGDELEVDDRDHGIGIAHGTWRVEQCIYYILSTLYMALSLVKLVGRSVEWVKGRHGNAAGSIVEGIAICSRCARDLNCF
jgi:hypothetical protein